MQLSKFDAAQVKAAFHALRACGIEPTAPTMQALVETAEAHYPDDPASLEKAARSLATFFAGSAEARTDPRSSWHWLRVWAFSVLRF
ncbi:MAG: hypothetical protein KME27_24405 [Lyngbya sp. HA4199-MV5]|jgi:phage tail tape-measure protein|nr:hypothetical protein [Lyngbya sp. HA4199-MV5]